MTETRAQEQKRIEETIRQLVELHKLDQQRIEESIRQLKDEAAAQSGSISKLLDLVVSLNAKYDSVISKQNSDKGPEQGDSSFVPPKIFSAATGSVQTRYTKIDFPRFSGEDPAGWIYKCERFFEFNQIEDDQKIRLAVVHLDDKAIQWYQWFEKTQTTMSWKEFTFGLRVRFGPNAFEDAMGELTKLTQQTTVRAYQERFESLASRTTGLTEDFFVSCFVSGLKDEIKAGVQMFSPTNISQAIGLARLQEEGIEAIARKARQPAKPPDFEP